MLVIKINDVKKFMNQLLIGSMFDSFSLVEVSITTFSHFTIDGKLHKEFFDTAASQEFADTSYCSWKDLKSYCFSIIRGKLPPVQFRITFQLSLEQYAELFSAPSLHIFNEHICGLNLNLQYRDRELVCTTGISADTFILDKNSEFIWNSAVQKYFQSFQLDFDKL